jgi:hypothetical protein
MQNFPMMKFTLALCALHPFTTQRKIKVIVCKIIIIDVVNLFTYYIFPHSLFADALSTKFRLTQKQATMCGASEEEKKLGKYCFRKW